MFPMHVFRYQFFEPGCDMKKIVLWFSRKEKNILSIDKCSVHYTYIAGVADFFGPREDQKNTGWKKKMKQVHVFWIWKLLRAMVRTIVSACKLSRNAGLLCVNTTLERSSLSCVADIDQSIINYEQFHNLCTRSFFTLHALSNFNVSRPMNPAKWSLEI